MIQTVNVYLNQFSNKQLVGKLALKDRKIYFQYENQFLEENINLSPYLLPLKKDLQICNDNVFNGLFGLFADSLPDGWGRLLLDRHLMSRGINFKDINELDRLCYVGKYGMGSLTYEPYYEEKPSFNENIILDDLAYSSLNILNDNEDEKLDTLLAIEGSSAGARPKVMLQINNQNEILHSNQKLKEGFKHYIVKFPSSVDNKESGKLEYIYSQIASKANIVIPKTKLLVQNNNFYFAIERFDRKEDKRIHIHSVSGLTHSDFRIPTLDYDDLMKLTFNLTKDFNEVIKLFKLATFNLFTHNRDDHGKNFSFMLDDNKNWKLTPAYDLTFSYGPGAEHSTTYLNEGKNPTIEHLEKLAKKHSIKNFKEIIEEIKYGVSNFDKIAKDVDLSNIQTNNLQKIINRNLQK